MPSATLFRHRRGIRLAGFAVLLLASRLLLLFAGLDPEEDRVSSYLDAAERTWTRGPERPLYDREELYAGAAAELMRLDPPLPPRAYQFMPYGSGSLLVAQIARPLFALFGPTYLAFKLLALGVTLVGGLCWYAAVRLWLGPRGALWFAGLYLLAPTVLVRTALIAKGDHSEAMAWIGLTAWLASAAGFAVDDRRRRWLAALAGLAAGLGVAITYSTVPITAALGAVGAVRSRLRPRRAWVWAAAGLVLGLLPWMASALSTGFGALRVYSRPLGALLPPGEILARLLLALRSGFLASYDLPAMIRPTAGLLWLLTVIASWIFLAAGAPRGRGRMFLFAGTAAHLLAFAAAAPDASSRYLTPVYPLLLAAVAGAAVVRRSKQPAQGRPPRSPSFFLPVPVMALGLAAQLLVVSASGFPGLRAPLRGYDWPLLGEVLGTKLTSEGVRVLPERVRPYVWVGVGRRLARQDPVVWGDEAARAGDEAEYVWEGIGVGALESGRWRLAAPVLGGLPEQERAALRRGLWRYGEVVFAPLLVRSTAAGVRAVVEEFEPADQAECRRVLARTAAMLAVQRGSTEDPVVDATLAWLRPEERAEAAGWALFRSVHSRGIRWWRPARGGALEDWYELALRPAAVAASPADLAAFWRGAAAAWGAELRTLAPAHLIGRREGPWPVLREAAAATAGLAAGPVGEFYRAAGSAVAEAWRDPARDPRLALDPSSWRDRVPAPCHHAFLQGLRGVGLEPGE